MYQISNFDAIVYIATNHNSALIVDGDDKTMFEVAASGSHYSEDLFGVAENIKLKDLPPGLYKVKGKIIAEENDITRVIRIIDGLWEKSK